MDELRIADSFVIPAAELVERFTTSGGPGGQHANRSATRVVLTFELAASEAFDHDTRRLLIDRLGSRLRNGALSMDVDESRSQWRNRRLARQRLRDMLEEALRPATPRVPTRPSRAAKRRRLEAKRATAAKKALRRPPEPE